MKKWILFLVLFFASFYSEIKASHIVGGNFEMVYSGRGYLYNVYMDMFYDNLNAAPGLLDADLTINIVVYSKATNEYVTDFQLIRPVANNSDFLSYSSNCAAQAQTLSAIVQTRLFRYTGEVNLTGLTEPEGYYISWERCCRNYKTINIVQEDMFGNIISGQVFYLEFPPVEKAGVRFVNSSPVFGQVPAEFLCENNFININFSATDKDGDSLVYSMIDPKQGHTTNNNAVLNYPLPAPYIPIGWQPGYSATNAIHGHPNLGINSATGILSVNPSEVGLFAFSVLCTEYRNGVQIGEVQRDFQYLIVDCPPVLTPSVGLNASNNGNSNVGSTNWGGGATPDTLLVKLNKDTCYTIFVTDSSSIYGTSQEHIYYGFTNLPHSVLAFSPSQINLTHAGDTATMNMCFSACDKILITRDSVYYLDIVVKNGGTGPPDYCYAKTDTLRAYIHVVVEVNNSPPKVTTSLGPDNFLLTHPDSLVKFYVYGTDPDPNDISVITATGYHFNLSDYRMNFTKIYGNPEPDSLAYLFTWTPTCEDLQNGILDKITFSIKDASCIYTHHDTTSVTMRLQDVDTGLENIKPSDLITPNGDGLNDCFYIPNIPPDNCTVIFKSVEIYNRWGARIYYSSDRNFKWCAGDVSDGIYYYTIDLSVKRLKEWIQVLR